MDGKTGDEDLSESRAPNEDSPRIGDAKRAGGHLALASLICALVFPAIMYGGAFADACGMHGPPFPGARSAVAVLFTMSSFSAVVLAICSMGGGIRMTSLIALVVGAVELFMCLGFAS